MRNYDAEPESRPARPYHVLRYHDSRLIRSAEVVSNTGALSRNLWLSLACLAASGAADSVGESQRHTLRDLLPPDRVAAAHDTFASGGPRLGPPEAGIVAMWTSAPTAVALGGLGTAVAALAVWRSIPGLARYQWEPDSAGQRTDTLQSAIFGGEIY